MNYEEYFEKVLEELLENCLRGLLHYRIWDTTASFIRDKPDLLDNYNYFFGQSLSAQIGMSQLYLMKLYDRSGSSIDVNSLLKRAQKNPSILKHEESPVELIKRLESKLNEIKPITDNLKEIRDNHFVHLSKKHLRAYSKVYEENSVQRKQIKKALDVSADVLNELNVAFRSNTLFMRMDRESDTIFLLKDLYEHFKLCD